MRACLGARGCSQLRAGGTGHPGGRFPGRFSLTPPAGPLEIAAPPGLPAGSVLGGRSCSPPTPPPWVTFPHPPSAPFVPRLCFPTQAGAAQRGRQRGEAASRAPHLRTHCGRGAAGRGGQADGLFSFPELPLRWQQAEEQELRSPIQTPSPIAPPGWGASRPLRDPEGGKPGPASRKARDEQNLTPGEKALGLAPFFCPPFL